MMRTSITAATLFFLGMCFSCDPDGVGPSSGVPRNTAVSALTAAQVDTVCDWVNAKQGGYGRSVTCADNTTQSTDDDKATCVGDAPALGAACPDLSVGDIEDCANAVGTDLCSVTSKTACARFRSCLASAGASG